MGKFEVWSQPLKLRPILVPRVWGGSRLAKDFHRESSSSPSAAPTAGDPIGESWEVSDVGESAEYHSVVADGPARGLTLRALLSEHPREILGSSFHPEFSAQPTLPLLYKFVDAREHLSVQVHPSDELVRALGLPGHGKTEAWVVVMAEPGSRIIYGLEEGVAYTDYLRRAQKGEGRSGLRWHAVRPGDVIFLPAGTLHSVGAGLLIAEIQQSSDTTYRIYDWDRMGLDGKPRKLHLEEAAKVVPPVPLPPCPYPAPAGDGGLRRRLTTNYFLLDEISISSGELDLPRAEGEFAILSLLSGEAGLAARDGAERRLGRGTTLFVPAACSPCRIRAIGPIWALWMRPNASSAH